MTKKHPAKLIEKKNYSFAQASAEFQNQKQRLQNFGRQAQSQTHFNLGEGKGKKFESSSRNDMLEGGQQQQDQTQTFDTSFYDEQSESNSEELGAVQKQAQTKGFKLELVLFDEFF